MKKLLNTLYVTSENSYLALDGENVVSIRMNSVGCLCIILKELFHLDIAARVRRLWVHVQTEIFLCAI